MKINCKWYLISVYIFYLHHKQHIPLMDAVFALGHIDLWVFVGRLYEYP